jgi:hypothetical protein
MVNAIIVVWIRFGDNTHSVHTRTLIDYVSDYLCTVITHTHLHGKVRFYGLLSCGAKPTS